MGEMADFILDNAFLTEDDQEIGVRCKYCNRGYFFWEINKDGKWRLHTYEGQEHKCSAYIEARLEGKDAV